MSNGPYLEVSFGESGSAAARAISGEDLRAASGKVTGHIRVQCANWLDIDTVQVLVNGRPADGLTFTRQSHPQLFGTGVVKFEQSVELQLAGDAHLVVLVGHATQVLGGVVGPDWGQQHPTAAQQSRVCGCGRWRISGKPRYAGHSTACEICGSEVTL